MSGQREQQTVVIDPRFRGPDESGNGGYVAGLLAGHVGATVGGPAATVTLRMPPPLGTPLGLTRGAAGHVRLTKGDALVAEADPAAPDLDPTEAVDPVPFARAAAVEADYPGLQEHPFPHCFVCGPQRDPGDGLRLFPGRLDDGTRRTACTWTPDPSLADETGGVPARMVWAALDCPGGWSAEIEGRPMVLGRMTARVVALPEVGERCVVMGRLLGSEGRKVWTASTAYGADGRELGRAHATWITLTS